MWKLRKQEEIKLTDTKAKIVVAGLALAAVCILSPQRADAQVEKTQMDGVMGQSISDETVYTGSTQEKTQTAANGLLKQLPAQLGATSYSSAFLTDTFVTQGDYTSATYYHKGEYEEKQLINGIDVSYWQADASIKKKYSSDRTKWTQTGINWSSVHDAGIDFAFVRVASRDTKDGSIYEDNCADSHIQGALDNNINVGLYFFSQALNEEEAEEEAEYVLNMAEEHGWDITMPIVMDREAGANKRLTAGKLSKAKETAICQAFADTITEAGYRAVVYASYAWIKNYIDTDLLDNCPIWIARYKNTTTNNDKSGTPFADQPYDYEFWQYSSQGKVDGYTGSLDVNFWYKDIAVKTTGLSVTGASSQSVSLSWDQAAEDVTGYRVYRFDEAQNKFIYLKAVKGTGFQDTTIVDGKTYRYKVRCYWTIGGTNYYGTYSTEVSSTTPPAEVTGLCTTDRSASSITLSWDAAAGAAGYTVYAYDADSKTYEKIAEVTDNATSYQITELDPATVYRFKVEAFEKNAGGTVAGAASKEYEDVTLPEQIQGAEAAGADAAVSLSWEEAAGAGGYQIYRLNTKTGKYAVCTTIKKADTTAFQDTKLAANTTYTYKIRAYKVFEGENYYGEFSKPVKAKTKAVVTKPAKVTGLKASSKSSAVTLKWNKVSKAGGYQIYRLNTKTGKYTKLATVKGETKTSYSNTKLTKKKTYKYKVRAYKTSGGKTVYGAFSSPVKMTVK